MTPPTEKDMQVAREIASDVRRQNWKMGGALVMDNDEAEAAIATALAAKGEEGAERISEFRDRAAVLAARAHGLTERIAAAEAALERADGMALQVESILTLGRSHDGAVERDLKHLLAEYRKLRAALTTTAQKDGLADEVAALGEAEA